MRSRKIFGSFIVFLLLMTWMSIKPHRSYAAPNCGDYTLDFQAQTLEFTIPNPGSYLLPPDESYVWEIENSLANPSIEFKGNSNIKITKNPQSILVNGSPAKMQSGSVNEVIQTFSTPQTYIYRVGKVRGFLECVGSITIISQVETACTNLALSPPANGSYYNVGESFTYQASINVPNTKLISKLVDAAGQRRQDQCSGLKTDEFGNFNGSLTIGSGVPGTWILLIGKDLFWVCDFDGDPICSVNIQVGTAAPGSNPGQSGIKEICTFIKDGTQQKRCLDCAAGALTGGKPGVLTPFGCIEADLQGFIQKLLKIAISVAGGIAFIMIIYGGFVTMTSSGNPERLTTGKEIITSAIAGLLLIIFSVVILKIIGVDILVLPGLSP